MCGRLACAGDNDVSTEGACANLTDNSGTKAQRLILFALHVRGRDQLLQYFYKLQYCVMLTWLDIWVKLAINFICLELWTGDTLSKAYYDTQSNFILFIKRGLHAKEYQKDMKGN